MWSQHTHTHPPHPTLSSPSFYLFLLPSCLHCPPASHAPNFPLSQTSQHVAGCCRVLQCIAVCCSVLQRVAVYCSVLQCALEDLEKHVLQVVAVYCSVLQCVAVCCSVLQCVAVCCSVRWGTSTTTTLSILHPVTHPFGLQPLPPPHPRPSLPLNHYQSPRLDAC